MKVWMPKWPSSTVFPSPASLWMNSVARRPCLAVRAGIMNRRKGEAYAAPLSLWKEIVSTSGNMVRTRMTAASISDMAAMVSCCWLLRMMSSTK
jgi:hypothetical protein